MKRLTALLLFLSIGCAGRSIVYDPPRRMVVKTAVANLRADRVAHKGAYKFDPLQETQMEKGEPVLVHEKNGKWFRVEASEQLEFSHHSKWEGYPGWMHKDNLTTDLLLFHKLTRPFLSEDKMRKNFKKGRKTSGFSLFVGRTVSYEPEIKIVATGVDCSGLINWSFRQMGWFIPRDAHEQYLRSKRIEPGELKPGDLVFFANVSKPEKIVHVSFYEGDDQLLEAPSSGKNVRRIKGHERFGKKILELKNGEQVKDQILYFGTFFAGDK